MVSDRFSAYKHLPTQQRQLCWAHLILDLVAIAELPGSIAEFGAELLDLQRQLFDHWHRYKSRTIDWSALQQSCRPTRQAFEAMLQRVVELGYQRGEQTPWAKTVRTCLQILQLADGLWTFLETEGIEPTNNAAERALRQSVIQRKIQSWLPVPPGSDLPQPPAHRHDQPQETGPLCLGVPGASLDCPSPWRDVPSLLPDP
ncbi:transposase [Cyanobium sp. ATX 6A2]|uniref:IS66 family transposase n=1 Tax=Cyanobium sp. ATX 6A2 TaxID=2823700 RepID=UPI0037C10776